MGDGARLSFLTGITGWMVVPVEMVFCGGNKGPILDLLWAYQV